MKISGGFYKYAWDPVEGCRHGCPYCYARTYLSARGKDFDTPTFYEKRLIEPSLVKPCRIFVNHFSDIMGDFIPSGWIDKIIEVIKSLPLHTFIFITKNPKRYYEFDFTDNCILGVTCESPAQWERVELMKGLRNRKMCSIEPLLGDFTGYDFAQFEFVVIGDLIGKVDHKHYDTILHSNKYFTR